MTDMSFQKLVLEKLEKLDKLDERMATQEQTTDKLLAAFVDLNDFTRTQLATKDELADAKNDLSQQLDLIAKQVGDHEDERVMTLARLDRLEGGTAA